VRHGPDVRTVPRPSRPKEIRVRRIVATLWMSLDGVVEAPETWAFGYSNDEVQAANEAGMAASDAMLLGRVTYEKFAAYWPQQGSDVPIADYINATPKLVVSTTLDTVEWRNSELINGDIVRELSVRKQQPGKDLTVVGSPTLMRSLLQARLLDELRLMIPPLVLGHGQRLFPEGVAQTPLRLMDAQPFSNGVLYLTYQPADA
jgi:dihydrofolate reductase